MASFNKVILLGNLTKDPQLSYLPSNTPVVEFGLASNRTFRKQDGSQGEEVCFVDCQMFGKRAEVINKYLHKGDPLFIEGRLKFDSWPAQDGSRRSMLRVFVENFEFLGGRRNSGQQGANSGRSGGAGERQSSAAADSGQDFDSPAFDPTDDIPF